MFSAGRTQRTRPAPIVHGTSSWWTLPFHSTSTASAFELSATPALDSSIYVTQAAELANLQSSFLITMRDRGFLHQCSGLLALDAILSSTQSAYIGFDATADSLHVGSLLQIMILRHFQDCGHRPIVLMGGATSKVGDPTGKDASRVMLTDETIQANIQGISRVFAKFLRFDDSSSATNAVMVNNDDWLGSLGYLSFLREFGTYFTINRMLSFESVKQRLDREAPFSFLEFNYMILQAYDFYELYRRYQVILQLGGSDQWGNMVSGTELIRRVHSSNSDSTAPPPQVFALTAPLITTSDGKKMGKTANGAVWLNAERLSPYEYWQFWRNTNDDDVIRFLKLFTLLPLTQIEQELAPMQGSAAINQAKIILADEATSLLHGPEVLPGIHETVQAMFASGTAGGNEGLPRVELTRHDFSPATDNSSEAGIKYIDLLVQLKLASSKKEARRLISGGGARVVFSPVDAASSDNVLVLSDENAVLSQAALEKSPQITIRAGKKRAGVVELIEQSK
jgi:tyrosyl-tRNA synthetase